MNRSPAVSVIIATFNYSRYLPHALNSLQEQRFTDWECIVVDDGSTDGTKQIVSDYRKRDSRIRYVWQPNSGPSLARNNGLARSNGRFIQFLDGDDLIQPNTLLLHVAYLEAHPDVDLIYGEAQYFTDAIPEHTFYSKSHTNNSWMPKISGTGRLLVQHLLENNIMVIEAPLLRRQVIDTIGGFDESLPALEDWEYWLRCALSGFRFQFNSASATDVQVRLHQFSLSTNHIRNDEAALAIRRRLQVVLTDPELLAHNALRLRELEMWRGWMSVALVEIRKIISPNESFILIDENQLISIPEFTAEYSPFPFLQREGTYWGRPEDDEMAIRELKSMLHRSIKYVVFVYPAFWWLDHYKGFANYLRRTFCCVAKSDYLLVYDLS